MGGDGADGNSAMVRKRSPHAAAERPDSATIGWMNVPGRVAAATLLSSLDPPARFVAHARAVAEVAAVLDPAVA